MIKNQCNSNDHMNGGYSFEYGLICFNKQNIDYNNIISFYNTINNEFQCIQDESMYLNTIIDNTSENKYKQYKLNQLRKINDKNSIQLSMRSSYSKYRDETTYMCCCRSTEPNKSSLLQLLFFTSIVSKL